MRRRDILIRLGLLGAGLGGAWWFRDHVLWREPELAFPATGMTPWLPYAERRAATPTVDVTLNGRTVRALIDSGAQYSVIDRALFQDLGLTEAFDMPLVAYGVGGNAQVGRGTTLALDVGGMAVTGLRAAILGLGPLADSRGLGAPLILGQDVLGRLVLEVDAEKRRVRLVRPDAFTPDPDMRETPAKTAGRALAVMVTAEGAEVEAVVDTGATAVLAMTRGAAEAAGLLDGRATDTGTSIVLGGAIEAQTLTARTVTIGDALYRQVTVAIYGAAPIPGFPQALVGMEAFDGRRVALDLAGPRLWTSRTMEVRVERSRRRAS